MLAGGDHHEVAGGAQALQSLVRAWNCLDARRKVAAAEELVHTLVALVRGTAPDLCKIVDPVVSNVVLQPISLQAKFVKGVQKAA
jgi:hypothetical protein